jgi:phosphoglycolate phosphatase-like HAD superfamily hydrolase
VYVIFDLDGTLSLDDHRRDYLTDRTPPDWRAYFDACGLDEPNRAAINTLRALVNDGNAVSIWTGRIERTRQITEMWLKTHLGEDVFDKILLKMRPDDDFRSNAELKGDWLEKANRKPDLAFDDMERSVQMWRSYGIPCFQVAPGPVPLMGTKIEVDPDTNLPKQEKQLVALP